MGTVQKGDRIRWMGCGPHHLVWPTPRRGIRYERIRHPYEVKNVHQSKFVHIVTPSIVVIEIESWRVRQPLFRTHPPCYAWPKGRSRNRWIGGDIECHLIPLIHFRRPRAMKTKWRGQCG